MVKNMQSDDRPGISLHHDASKNVLEEPPFELQRGLMTFLLQRSLLFLSNNLRQAPVRRGWRGNRPA